VVSEGVTGWKALRADLSQRLDVEVGMNELTLVVSKVGWLPKRMNGKYRHWTLLDVIQIAGAFGKRRLCGEAR
jgi:hypothetical protein